MEYLRIGRENPESLIDERLSQPLAQGLLAVEYELQQYWLERPAPISLVAVYQLPSSPEQAIEFLVLPCGSAVQKRLEDYDGSLQNLAEGLNADIYSSQQPVALQPVVIPKPWGEEIWYTGVEQRGVAEAGRSGLSLPLPWVLSALPRRLCNNRQQQLVLLKILAPLPEEVYGDLYFELHQEKREVYVITHIDGRAWPDGIGSIRFGFDEQRRREFGSDEVFRSAFVQAVREYERVRRQIDALLDQRRREEGIAADAALDAIVLQQWLDEVPGDLRDEEFVKRRAMDEFSARLPLMVGDVVKVPTLTPHSLQHGVRAVEFQTPVYERLIVSFAQKVLTQDHWDTDRAVNLMRLDTPHQEPSVPLRGGEGWCEERIVDFADFEVRRYIVRPGAQMRLEPQADYGVLMAVKGALPLGNCSLAPEQAAILPGLWPGASFNNNSAEELIFLVAYPR